MDNMMRLGSAGLQDFSFMNVRLATVANGEHGLLVMKSDQLVAVLTQVDEEVYSVKGGWFLETGFGKLGGHHRLFASLDEATSWIADRFEADGQQVLEADAA
ncbi:hypothetical protein [Mesorhizobium sp. KR1-2]|uniref:hypothetical protein n=1 Tax=Mesorhizobium sp. KR1-2 TaxID=3156609 RepID=UPI0032B31EB5